MFVQKEMNQNIEMLRLLERRNVILICQLLTVKAKKIKQSSVFSLIKFSKFNFQLQSEIFGLKNKKQKKKKKRKAGTVCFAFRSKIPGPRSNPKTLFHGKMKVCYTSFFTPEILRLQFETAI